MSWQLALALSITSAVASLWLTRTMLVRLPADYFVTENVSRSNNRLVALARNAAGALLVIVGLLLSIPGVPGQGLLTMVCGVLLLDFPGKRGFERRFLAHPKALAAVNRLRERARVAPLLAPIGPSSDARA